MALSYICRRHIDSMLRFFLLITLISIHLSVNCQIKPILIQLENNPTSVIRIKVIGKDTICQTIRYIDSVKFDFSKDSSYKINIRVGDVSISIDSIRKDIDKITINIDFRKASQCEYYIDRYDPVISISTDCLGENCNHKIIAYASMKKIDVLRGTYKSVSRGGETRYFMDGQEIKMEKEER